MRRKTQTVSIGNLNLGSDFPVRVQSMTNTDTQNIQATVSQSLALIEAGCEMVRITVPSLNDVEAFKEIRQHIRAAGFETPLIADVHFNPKIAEKVAYFAEKVRINPGNYTDKKSLKPKDYTETEYQAEVAKIYDRLRPLLAICKTQGTALRIGSNHGSLSDRIINRYGNTALGMVKSAMEFLEICEDFGFHRIVVSMKSSHIQTMMEATMLMAQEMDAKGWNYPLHLGVTEAGCDEEGRTKSAIGIGGLLAMGYGDTIRVSLTESPLKEIPFAEQILQSLGLKFTKTEFISCPSCGRTRYDIQAVTQEVKRRFSNYKGLKLAVMGCVVNGPGEMADAHFGIVGTSDNSVAVYQGKNRLTPNISIPEALDFLERLIAENYH